MVRQSRKYSRSGICLLKLGGSILTDKGMPFTLNNARIRSAAKELASYVLQQPVDERIIIVHGGGSFSHTVADMGATSPEEGGNRAILTTWAARDLNGGIMEQFIGYGLNAFSLEPSAFLYAENGLVKSIHTTIIEMLLARNWIPVLYGDIILETGGGEHVLSGDAIVDLIARQFEVNRIILFTDRPGVLMDIEDEKSIIDVIDERNIDRAKAALKGAVHKDVTGGMERKVSILYRLAVETGVRSLITDGREEGNIERALLAKYVKGTMIRYGEAQR